MRVTDRQQSLIEWMLNEGSSMLRHAMIVLAIVLVTGSSGLSNSAFARGGYSGGDNCSRVGHFDRCFGSTPGGSHGGYGHRISGLRGVYGHESGDVWGHWGAYYGPMIPNSF